MSIGPKGPGLSRGIAIYHPRAGADGRGVESRRASLRLACQDNAPGLPFHLHRVQINLGILSMFVSGARGRPMAERSKVGVGMTAVKCMAAVAMMAGLLTGPVAAPNGRPDRPRRGFYPWHVFMDWLGCRGGGRPGSGGTARRRGDHGQGT